MASSSSSSGRGRLHAGAAVHDAGSSSKPVLQHAHTDIGGTERWWRNIRYGTSKGDKSLLAYDSPDHSSPSRPELVFGERFRQAGESNDGNDLWLKMESGLWVLARGAGVVNCVELAHWKAHRGRIPEAAHYGQDYPEALYTEGYGGSSAICVVSASGDAFWKQVNIEMLYRDIATTTIFEKDWEGDEVFRDWVAFFAMNFPRYGNNKKFVVIVKPTCSWSKFVDKCVGVALNEVKDHVGLAQWKELNWIFNNQHKLACKWKDVEFVTALAFLKKYCSWSEPECRAAALEKLLGYCARFHTLDSTRCSKELDCAFWCWMEAFHSEGDFDLKVQAAIGHRLLQKLAMREKRPSLEAVDFKGPGRDAWATLLVEAQSVDPEVYKSLQQEPIYELVQEQRRRAQTLQKQASLASRELREKLEKNQQRAALIQDLHRQCEEQASKIARLEASGPPAAAVRPSFVISAGADCNAHMWSAETGQCMRRFEGHDDQIWSCCLSLDESKLFTTSHDGTAKMWDVRTGECIRTFHHQEGAAPNWACVTPDLKFLATAVNDSTAKIWDVGTGSLLEELEHDGGVNSVCMSSDGKFLYTASGDTFGRKWSVPEGKLIMKFDGNHSEALYSCFLADRGRLLFATSWDGRTSLFDASSGRLLGQYKGPGEAWNVVASPSGEFIYIARDKEGGSKSQKLRSNDSEEVQTFLGHEDTITAQWVSEDGRWLCTSSLDGTAKLWDACAGGEALVTYKHEGFVQGIIGGMKKLA